MFLTLEKPNGMRLVLDVSRLCYLGEPVEIDMRFQDFVADASIRFATEQEELYFAQPSEVNQ